MSWDDLVEAVSEDLVEAVVTGDLATGLPKATVKRLLRTILGLHSAEVQLLRSIDRNTRALMKGPFKTGLEYLDEAQDDNRSVEQRVDSLQLAKPMFMNAYGNLKDDNLWASLCELHIGLCWLMFGSIYDAKKWIRRSYESAEQVIKDIEQQANDPKLHPWNVVSMPLVAIPWLGSAVAFKGHREITKRRINEAAGQINEISSYEAAVRRIGARLGIEDFTYDFDYVYVAKIRSGVGGIYSDDGGRLELEPMNPIQLLVHETRGIASEYGHQPTERWPNSSKASVHCLECKRYVPLNGSFLKASRRAMGTVFGTPCEPVNFWEMSDEEIDEIWRKRHEEAERAEKSYS